MSLSLSRFIGTFLAAVLGICMNAAIAVAQSNENAAFQPQEVVDLESKILAHRKFIHSAHFQIHRVYDKYASKRHSVEDIETFIDGNKVRQNVVRDGIKTSVAFGDRYMYWYDDQRLPNNDRFGLLMYDLHVYPGARKEYGPYQPLTLMFYSGWYMSGNTLGFDSAISAPKRDHFKVDHSRSDGGLEEVKVSFHLNGNQFKYTVVPERSFNVTHMESQTDDGRYMMTTDCTLDPIGGGLWFPRHWRHHYTLDGKAVQDELLDIAVDAVNARVDPAEFSPATMSVPIGDGVIRNDVPGQFKWDGSEAVPMTKREVAVMVYGATRGKPSTTRAVLHYSAISLGTVGCAGIVVRLIARQRSLAKS